MCTRVCVCRGEAEQHIKEGRGSFRLIDCAKCFCSPSARGDIWAPCPLPAAQCAAPGSASYRPPLYRLDSLLVIITVHPNKRLGAGEGVLGASLPQPFSQNREGAIGLRSREPGG